MAEGKKSFLLYSDYISTVEKLGDENAGKLFKHILRYVNDQNPTPENQIIDLVFEQIRVNLKRDLKKWENRAQRSRKNGALGGRPKNPEKPSGLNKNPEEPRKPDTVNVTVNVNDINNKPFNFKKSLIEYGFEKQLVEDYLKNRKTKKLSNTKTAYEGLIKEFQKISEDKNSILRIVIEKGWGGFKSEWIESAQKENKKSSWKDRYKNGQ